MTVTLLVLLTVLSTFNFKGMKLQFQMSPSSLSQLKNTNYIHYLTFLI